MKVMSCQFVKESISSFVDDRLAAPDRQSVAAHLATCAECATRYGQTGRLRQNLRALPVLSVPKQLSVNLQILSSKELMRRQQSAWARFLGNMRLTFNNLMRPFALPCAGGFASALFIFGTLMPNLGFLRSSVNDRPTPLFTEASVDSVADFGATSKSADDTLIEVQIDGQGRMVDYNVQEGQMTSEIGNMLLFTTFTPATNFLKPTTGKLVIRVSRIVVKG